MSFWPQEMIDAVAHDVGMVIEKIVVYGTANDRIIHLIETRPRRWRAQCRVLMQMERWGKLTTIDANP